MEVSIWPHRLVVMAAAEALKHMNISIAEIVLMEDTVMYSLCLWKERSNIDCVGQRTVFGCEQDLIGS